MLEINTIVNAFRYMGDEVIGYIDQIERSPTKEIVSIKVLFACGDPVGWIPAIMVQKANAEEIARFEKERAELGLLPLDQM